MGKLMTSQRLTKGLNEPMNMLVTFMVVCHEIKRYLLFGRKAMTNLDSVLKSRDNTLLINIHIVKAMVFPVVVYGCESWTIRKSECQRTDPFKL